MRKNIKNAASTFNSNLKTIHRKRPYTWLVISNLIIALIIGMWFTPKAVDHYRSVAEARALAAAIIKQQQIALAEEQRKAEETAIMVEYYCLANTLYWEAERGNAVDHQAIADVVFSRMASPLYPDTICDVTQEVRQNHKGQDVAMFSYIFDIAGKPAPSGKSWKFSRLQAALAYKDHFNGKKPSGNLNYHADYVSPLWKTKDVAECKLRPVEISGAFHTFYAPVALKDRRECLNERKFATVLKAKSETITLPKKGPVPTPRPSNDEVANLILTNG